MSLQSQIAIGWLCAGLATAALVWRAIRDNDGHIDKPLVAVTVIAWPAVLVLAACGIGYRVKEWLMKARSPLLAIAAFRGIKTTRVRKGDYVIVTGASQEDAARAAEVLKEYAPAFAHHFFFPGSTGLTVESLSEKEMAARGWKRVTPQEVRSQRADAVNELLKIAATQGEATVKEP